MTEIPPEPSGRSRAVEYVVAAEAEEALPNAADVFLPILVFVGESIAAGVIGGVVGLVWNVWGGDDKANSATLPVHWCIPGMEVNCDNCLLECQGVFSTVPGGVHHGA